MSKDYIERLRHSGFFKRNAQADDGSLHLVAPYKITITAAVVNTLRSAYLSTEEAGGMLWANARTKDGERELFIDSISIVRNAIEDKSRSDGMTKAVAYLPDSKEKADIFQQIIEAEHLPIDFHTHPIGGANIVHQIGQRVINMDTSDADRRESYRLHQICGAGIHLPRALVMGDTIGKELFIRFYGGNNSPFSFADASKEVMTDNLASLSKLFDWNSYSKGQKVMIGAAGALVLLGALFRPKVAVAVAVAGTPLAMSFLTTTTTDTPSPHYCRLSGENDAVILVPEIA